MDSTTFKVFGIVIIFILTLFLCDPARSAGVEPLNAEPLNAEPVNTWDAVHELIHGDYGAANVERNALVAELDTVLALVKYTEARIDNFDFENGLDNLDARINALLELIKGTDRALESIVREVTLFVKNHKGV